MEKVTDGENFDYEAIIVKYKVMCEIKLIGEFKNIIENGYVPIHTEKKIHEACFDEVIKPDYDLPEQYKKRYECVMAGIRNLDEIEQMMDDCELNLTFVDVDTNFDFDGSNEICYKNICDDSEDDDYNYILPEEYKDQVEQKYTEWYYRPGVRLTTCSGKWRVDRTGDHQS